MNKFLRGAAVLATLSVPLALAGCSWDDLTRSKAAAILDGPGFSSVCVAQLSFVDNGFNKAQESGVIAAKPITPNWFAASYKIDDLQNTDNWRVLATITGRAVIHKDQPQLCFSGHAVVTSIADAPNAQNGSYKLVEFEEDVDVPPELAKLQPFVYWRYTKTAVFQKTDDGWRLAQ